jgi:hypothetical protein
VAEYDGDARGAARKPPEGVIPDWLVRAALGAGIFAACDWLLLASHSGSWMYGMSPWQAVPGFFAFFCGIFLAARHLWVWYRARRTWSRLAAAAFVWTVVLMATWIGITLVSEIRTSTNWRDEYDLRFGQYP